MDLLTADNTNRKPSRKWEVKFRKAYRLLVEMQLRGRGSQRKSSVLLLALGSAGLLLSLAIAGMLYQTMQSRRDFAAHPVPGQLIDIGGYRLHIHCLGQGSPTILFESGLGDDSLAWSRVQPEVARVTRTCTYDRAGYGWSDASPKPRTAMVIAEEFHALLQGAGVHGPFILVGHSFGGMFSRMYAGLYGSEVVGMVLVDSSSPNQFKRMGAEATNRMEASLRRQGYLQDTMPFGVPRISGWCDHWPAWEREVRRTTECRWQPWITHLQEFRAFDEDSRQVLATGSLGHLPLIVLSAQGTAGDRQDPNSFGAMQEELAHLSSRGSLVVAEGGHVIQDEHPEVVIDAVLKVMAEVRNAGPNKNQPLY